MCAINLIMGTFAEREKRYYFVNFIMSKYVKGTDVIIWPQIFKSYLGLRGLLTTI